MTSHLRSKFLGSVVQDIHVRVVKVVQDMIDISVEESERLYALCTMLYALEYVFGNPTEIEYYVPTCDKYHEMVQLLDMKLLDILEKFEQGRRWMNDASDDVKPDKIWFSLWTGKEMAKMVRALFSDTANRQRALAVFENDHTETRRLSVYQRANADVKTRDRHLEQLTKGVTEMIGRFTQRSPT